MERGRGIQTRSHKNARTTEDERERDERERDATTKKVRIARAGGARRRAIRVDGWAANVEIVAIDRGAPRRRGHRAAGGRATARWRRIGAKTTGDIISRRRRGARGRARARRRRTARMARDGEMSAWTDAPRRRAGGRRTR